MNLIRTISKAMNIPDGSSQLSLQPNQDSIRSSFVSNGYETRKTQTAASRHPSLALLERTLTMIIETPWLRMMSLKRAGRSIPQVLDATADAHKDFAYSMPRLWFVRIDGIVFAVLARSADEAWMQVDDVDIEYWPFAQ